MYYGEYRLASMKKKEEGLDPIDVHVGSKVRARRLLMGLSQDALAKLIGLTFQQVQKYERGTNRISVSRLIGIAKALQVPVNYFFGDTIINDKAFSQGGLAIEGFSDIDQENYNQENYNIDIEPLAKRDVMELVKAYSSIKNQNLKKQLLEMAKTMAKTDNTK